MHANPAVTMTFTMTGNGQFLASNQGFLLAFLQVADGARADQAVAGN